MHYAAYGLLIRSAERLPELLKATTPLGTAADVAIARTNQAISMNVAGEVCVLERVWANSVCLRLVRRNDRWLLDFPGVAMYCIGLESQPTIVEYQCYAGADEDAVRHMLIDQVLPIVCAARGGFAVHASSVQIGTSAVLLAADAGSGKSTLAAALSLSGRSVVCDDCAVISRRRSRRFVVASAYPGLRLWPSSVQALMPKKRLRRVAAYTSKRRYGLSDGIRGLNGGWIPLHAVYLLDNGGDSLSILPMPKLEAMMSLTRHTYTLDPTDGHTLKRNFANVANLISAIPVYRLRYPREFSSLHSVVGALEQHALEHRPA